MHNRLASGMRLSAPTDDVERLVRTANQVRKVGYLLQRQIEIHCRALENIQEGGGDRHSEQETIPTLGCTCSDCQRLKAAIVEAILVLDKTRRSFKSKQLERLRKRLTEALL